MISVKRIISKSTALIFAKFLGGVGRIMAVDDQSEISFSTSQRTLSRQPFFSVLAALLHRICISVVSSTELICWTQAASGAAGRANVGLCRACSY